MENPVPTADKMDVIERMKKEMFRRKMSTKTIKIYVYYVRKFLIWVEKEPMKISKKDCREFLLMHVHQSGNSMNVILNSLKFMMEEILRKSMKVNIKYSKVPQKKAEFLSKDEVVRIIDSITNEKHKLIVSLMYGSGLRVSEVVMLQKGHLDFENNIGWVRNGKGNKDRPFMIPTSLVEKLKAREDGFVFKGHRGHYSQRSVQEIVKKAGKKAGVLKNVHPHMFRHSFATHMLEDGYDAATVQGLLGHSEIRTTIGYLHTIKPKMLNVTSPLDQM